MGPAGLTEGVFNDHPIFDTLVRVEDGGTEAFSRGLELGQLGEGVGGKQGWEFTVFRNRFVKEGGVWKLREMRLFTPVKADYAAGWGKGGVTPPANRSTPAFLGAHPVTGKAINVAGVELLADEAAHRPRSPRRRLLAKGSDAERLAAARKGYASSWPTKARPMCPLPMASTSMTSQWPEMAGVFSEKGNKHSPFAGYYIGPERIIGAVNANYGTTTKATGLRTGIAYHWRTQPVIFVAADGRSANLRTRLIQTATGKVADGQVERSSFSSGMYPNDQAVIENGIWRLWALEIDEHYMTSSSWQGGWAGVKPVGADRPPSRPSQLLTKYPPDILMTEIGKRSEGLRGGTGMPVEWPGILPMWFNYRESGQRARAAAVPA